MHLDCFQYSPITPVTYVDLVDCWFFSNRNSWINGTLCSLRVILHSSLAKVTPYPNRIALRSKENPAFPPTPGRWMLNSTLAVLAAPVTIQELHLTSQLSCLNILHFQVLPFIQTPLPSIHTVSNHFQTPFSIIEMSDTQGTPADTLFTERESKMLGWVMQSLKSGPPEVRT